MASIDPKPTPTGKRRVRWRESPGGPQRMKDFDRLIDARRFKTEIEHKLLAGTYAPPGAGQITVAAYADEWIRRRHWAASTVEGVTTSLRLHILPGLGSRRLSALRRSHIEEWAAALPLAPSTVGTVHRTLSSMLATAVEDERIPRNPAAGARLPKVEGEPVVPMAADEVRSLAAATVEHIRAAVLVAAGTGLRQGELFGLTVDRIDFMRREFRVDRQLWSPQKGAPVFAPPKSKKSYRTVALSPLILETLAAHIAAFGRGRDGLVFHSTRNGPVSRVMGGEYMRAAVKRAGLSGVSWHDLRHHHASVLLSAGVSPALVAERLGHDIQTLMRTYAHVIRSDDDRVRAVVDETLGGSAEDWLRSELG